VAGPLPAGNIRLKSRVGWLPFRLPNRLYFGVVQQPEDIFAMKTRTHRSTEAGFTLIELLIVMSVILILMTLAVPAMQKVTINAHQTSAVQSLRVLSSAEGEYNAAYPQHGYACTLPALGGKAESGPPTAESAEIIADDLTSGNKAGYTFSITCGGKATSGNQDQYNSYTITAVPNSVGHSGNLGYCIDGNSQVHFDPKGGTNCTELLQ
jgi:type IV pilus assembly protein PilA